MSYDEVFNNRDIRGQQFLPGINWAAIHDFESGTERKARLEKLAVNNLSEQRVQSRRSRAQVPYQLEQIPKPARDEGAVNDSMARRADIPIPGLHAYRNFYTTDQSQEEASGLGKINNVTQSRPLPRNLRMEHTVHTDPWKTTRGHKITLYDDNPKPPSLGPGQVGSIEWNGDTGHVHYYGVQDRYRGTPALHLISEAHRVAREHGDTGPTNSSDLSEFSYRIAKQHAPSFIPEGTMVKGIDREDWDQGLRPDEDYDPDEHSDDSEEDEHQYQLGELRGTWARAYSLITSRRIPQHIMNPGGAGTPSVATHLQNAIHAHEDYDDEGVDEHMEKAHAASGQLAQALPPEHPEYERARLLHSYISNLSGIRPVFAPRQGAITPVIIHAVN
jgi:hypothetical protein